MADLVELDMIDFDVIHGMDWLHVSYVKFIKELELLSSNFLMSQI